MHLVVNQGLCSPSKISIIHFIFSGRGSAMSSASASCMTSFPLLNSSATKKSGVGKDTKWLGASAAVNWLFSWPLLFSDYLKDLLEIATRVEERLKIMQEDLQEILQRLRNRGKVLQRPRGMPQLPLMSETELKVMEKCLKKHSNFEYLVCTLGAMWHTFFFIDSVYLFLELKFLGSETISGGWLKHMPFDRKYASCLDGEVSVCNLQPARQNQQTRSWTKENIYWHSHLWSYQRYGKQKFLFQSYMWRLPS